MNHPALDPHMLTDTFEEVLLADLVPARLNDRVYRPVLTDDPEIVSLTASILRDGLLEKIVITQDNVIVSGHRRRVACQQAGLTVVTVRRLGIRSDHPDFERLLVSYNRQRTKGIDEVAREEVVLAAPARPGRTLGRYRRDRAHVAVPTIALRDPRKRSALSLAKSPFLQAVHRILSDLRAFLPLSLRQVHYNLLNDPPLVHANKPGSTYRNDHKFYKVLISLLTHARLDNHVPFEDIADETRTFLQWRTYAGPGPFIRAAFDTFLTGYARDLLQSQPNFIVIVGEKQTVEPILRPVAIEFTLPLVIARGYPSLPPRHQIATAFRNSGKEKLILVVASDHDPEGDDIPHSLARSMRDDFKIPTVEAVKAALTHDQVRGLRLVPNTTAKEKSSRRAEFIRRYGEAVYELEAVPPAQLQQMVRSAILGVLDLPTFQAERAQHDADVEKLNEIRARLLKTFQSDDHS